jgi:hypothetical protein
MPTQPMFAGASDHLEAMIKLQPSTSEGCDINNVAGYRSGGFDQQYIINTISRLLQIYDISRNKTLGFN